MLCYWTHFSRSGKHLVIRQLQTMTQTLMMMRTLTTWKCQVLADLICIVYCSRVFHFGPLKSKGHLLSANMDNVWLWIQPSNDEYIFMFIFNIKSLHGYEQIFPWILVLFRGWFLVDMGFHNTYLFFYGSSPRIFLLLRCLGTVLNKKSYFYIPKANTSLQSHKMISDNEANYNNILPWNILVTPDDCYTNK